MFNRISELFLFDIYVAILIIEEVVNRFDDAGQLRYDFMAWDTVIREFEIIGEATNRLIKSEILDERSRVVVDFRNLLIHHYFGINSEEIFDVAKYDLVAFKNIILQKIQQVDPIIKQEIIEEVCEENKHLQFVIGQLAKLK
jgi:uncharacterized protein with HEPN domain